MTPAFFPRPGSISPPLQDGQHHGETRRLRILAGTIPCLLCLTACNSGKDTSQSAGPGQASLVTSAAQFQANVQVTVQPALTPNFQLSIQDYVIDCNPSPSVQFTAQIGDALEAFVNGVRVARPGQTARATVPLVAGQRFTFAFAGSDAPLEYSVRCLPTGFPPISTSVAAVSQAQWYVFSPSIGGTQASYYVIVTDTNGTPVWWMEQAGGGTPIDAKIIGHNTIVWTTGDGDFSFRSFNGDVLDVL